MSFEVMFIVTGLVMALHIVLMGDWSDSVVIVHCLPIVFIHAILICIVVVGVVFIVVLYVVVVVVVVIVVVSVVVVVLLIVVVVLQGVRLTRRVW